MSKLPARRPWPMKGVFLVTLVFIIGYTWVRLAYQKPNPAYRPYQDANDQATVSRLLASGYQRMEVSAEQAAGYDPSLVLAKGELAAFALKAPGGLSKELDYALLEKPLLAESFENITVPAAAKSGKAYRLLLKAKTADNKRMINSAILFRKEGELTILPIFEPLHGGLEARWKECSLLVSIPAELLKEDHYEITVVGNQSSRKWTFSVQR